MKLVRLVLLCSLVATSGCVTVHSLDRHDRIPHEARKGYVSFMSEFEADTRSSFLCPHDPSKPPKYYLGCIGMEIDKTEHGYPIRLIRRLYLADKQMPVSERPGVHAFVIRYPSLVAIRVADGLRGKSAVEQAALRPVERGTALDDAILEAEGSTVESGSMWFSWGQAWSWSEKEVPIEVREGLVTPVGVNSVFTLQEEKRLGRNIVRIYRGEIKSIRVGEFLSIPSVEEKLEDRTGPRVYEENRQKVYALAVDAARALGWAVTSSFVSETASSFDVEIGRFPANTMGFTIGVYATPEGKCGVDLSSAAGWQRWGSFNTRLSRENMYAFYAKLDELLSTQGRR